MKGCTEMKLNHLYLQALLCVAGSGICVATGRSDNRQGSTR